MGNLAWINGEITSLSEAKVSLEDRGYLLGDGVYEVIRVYNGCTFYLEAHLERLSNSANAIQIEIPYSGSEIEKAVNDLIAESAYKDCYIYMQVTRGAAMRDHIFPDGVTPGMVMYVRPLAPLLAVEDVSPAKCITLPDERWMNCHIKTVNLLPNLLARQKAYEAKALEAILYRPGNIVTEGTRSNVFAIIDGVVRTHPQTNLILPGISRRIVLDLLGESDTYYEEKAFTVEDLKKASEVWLTSTSLEINPVYQVDEYKVKGNLPGPLTLMLMKKFREKISSECKGD
ncbi:MAG: D-amino-acid transaminase [Dethiobacteria bacterium]